MHVPLFMCHHHHANQLESRIRLKMKQNDELVNRHWKNESYLRSSVSWVTHRLFGQDKL